MAVTNKYSLYAVQLDDTADVLISGITTQGLVTQSATDQEVTTEVYSRWYALTGQNPQGRFGTYHLATALANFPLTGLSIAGLATGLALWLQKHKDEASREATLKHRKYLMTAGMVIPQALTVAHGAGQSAIGTFQVLPTYDGSNDPFQISDLQTLPTAEADDERFAIGPVQIGSKSLSHFRSVDIDFGINAPAESADGDVWPTFIAIESVNPRITFRGIDPEWLKSTNVPLVGLTCTHANTIFYLRKRAIGGTFVVNGTAEHIKFTAAGLAYVEEVFDATGQGASETNLVLPCSYDGTNAPLVINTASAIT